MLRFHHFSRWAYKPISSCFQGNLLYQNEEARISVTLSASSFVAHKAYSLIVRIGR